MVAGAAKPFTRFAGNALNFFQNNPLGEEILEGVVGGGLAGAALASTDMPAEEVAAKTAGAMLGGVALGIGGRNIGAALGKTIRSKPLDDQAGILASIARSSGNKTTFGKEGGLTQQMAVMKSGVQKKLVEDTSAELARQAARDPIGFMQQHGVSADVFLEQVAGVRKGIDVKTFSDLIKTAPPEQREKMINSFISKEFEDVEKLIRREASGSIDDRIKTAASFNKDGRAEDILGDYGKNLSETFQELAKGDQLPPVTGEQVGRAIGRFAGDEVGILAGMGIAGMLVDNKEDS